MSRYLFLRPLGGQKYKFLVTSGCILLERYDGLSESVAFVLNWGILQTRMDQREDHMQKNFDYFEIQKWMLQTEWKKPMKKMRSFFLFPRFLPELWFLNCLTKCIFLDFVLTSARNLSLLKQFIYVYLKILITLFQKIIWFKGFWATAHEILAIKISKKMLTQQIFNKILRLQTLISPKQ